MFIDEEVVSMKKILVYFRRQLEVGNWFLLIYCFIQTFRYCPYVSENIFGNKT